MSLINREVLLSFEKMDADLCATCGEHHTAEDVIMMIKTAPTVDAVPVVRCENCHHGEPCGDEIACLHPELAMETDGCTPIRKKDFFCAFGETKEGADNG